MLMKKRVIKRMPIMLILLFVIIIAFNQNIILASATSWVEVARFAGSGDERYSTDYFVVESPEWQILWYYAPNMQSPNQTFFMVFTHPRDNNTFFIDSIIKRGGSITEGNSCILHQKGTFYMIINTTNVESYSIRVLQETSSIPEIPSQSLLPLFAIATLLTAILWRRENNRDRIIHR